MCEAQYRQSGAAAQWIRWDSRWPRPSAPAGRPTGLDRKIYDGSNEPGQRSRPNCPDGAHAAPKGSEYQQIGLSGVRPAQSGGGLAARLTCNFCRMLCMWFLTMATLIANWRAISLLERPRPTSTRISLSRDDRFGSGACRSNSGCNRAWRVKIAAAMCGSQCTRPATASTKARWSSSASLSRAAAEACSGAGKDVIVGLVECKSDEPGPETDSLDCSRCRNGIRLAQIDEDDIGLCVSDLPDAMRVQVDDVDHYDVSTAAQGRAKPSPTR